MARKPRVHYPGALYHVILRGNAGQLIFDDDQDRTRFYLLTQEGSERFGHRIHAFCLMSNHIHLAIQVGAAALSRILKNLSFRYTRRINGRKLTDSRGMAGWLVLESGTGTLVQLGRLTGRDPSTLSSAAKRLQRRAQKDLQLAKRMKQLLETSS